VAAAPRADFVSKTLNTDQDIFSYGCAILFINYLVYQLGHPLEDVIRAGGSTLAETYSRLTGQPADAAYASFNELLQDHIRNSTTNNMPRDNIFPLIQTTMQIIFTAYKKEIDLGEIVLSGSIP